MVRQRVTAAPPPFSLARSLADSPSGINKVISSDAVSSGLPEGTLVVIRRGNGSKRPACLCVCVWSRVQS